MALVPGSENLSVGADAGQVHGRLRAVVSDLDGTLLRSDGTVSPTTADVLAALRRREVPVVVATARTSRAVRRIAGHERFGTMVCANGSVVWDAPTGIVVRETPFDRTRLSLAIDRLRTALPDIGLALLTADTMYADARYLDSRPLTTGKELITDPAHVLSHEAIVMVAVRHRDYLAEDLHTPVSVAFDGIGSASHSSLHTVDIAPAGVTKAATAAQVLADMACSLETTVVFGDMPNDLPLFKLAGWSCAVANAHPLVRKAADEIVAANDEDGVAIALRQLFALP